MNRLSHPRIACLWLPNWPIQRIVVAQPELRRQHLVLFRRDARRGQSVAAASPLALRDGVRVTMPLSEAKSLLNRTTSPFHIFEHDPAADLRALETLADRLEIFSPIVGLEQLEPSAAKRGQQPVSILLDLTGLDRLFGSEARLVQQISQYAGQFGYLTRIALANTIGVAWGASRFHFPGAEGANAQRVEKDAGWIIPPDDSQSWLQLPIETLRLEPATLATLHQLGIETNAQLGQLSRSDLAMRFGNEIHRRIDQASGQLEEPVIARHKPPEFQAQQALDYPTDHRETIAVIIARLITDICQQLRARQTGALQWTVRMLLVDELPLDFTVSLFQPTALLNQIMPLMEMQLEQILIPKRRSAIYRNIQTPESSGHNAADLRPPTSHPGKFRRIAFQVHEIQVSVTSCVLLVQRQRQLFDENPRLDKQALAQLINRLSTRLGQHNIVYPQLQSGAQPEFSYRFRPLVDVHRPHKRRPTKLPPQSHVAARPIRIFHPPVEVKLEVGGRRSEVGRGKENGKLEVGGRKEEVLTGFTLNLNPTLSSFLTSDLRPPACFSIVRSWGPERIETGWWRGRTVCRDYWRIETDQGQQFWLYRDLREDQWFVQGEY